MIQIALVLILLNSSLALGLPKKVFRFHLSSEPKTMNPSKMRGASSYFYGNLMRGLYVYDDEKGLVPEGARSCTWKSSVKLTCLLREDIKWSNGESVLSHDYVRAFRYFVDSKNKSFRFNLLENIKNAQEIYQGNLKPEKLGISAPSKFQLEFQFSQPDPEFLYSLVNPLLVPLKNLEHLDSEFEKTITNGPYQIKKWSKGKKVELSRNLHYFKKIESLVPVEVLFIKEDTTALTLYENGRLSFMTRLPFKLINAYKNRPDFFFRPLARFDYLGFGPRLKDLNLRKALSHSLDYKSLSTLMNALGRPGCSSLPANYSDQKSCIDYSLPQAKSALDLIDMTFRKQPFTIEMSQGGGDDHKQVSQWLQYQWQKKLGLNLRIRQTEKKVFFSRLKDRSMDIFRKGVGILRPTCSAALESFISSSPDNYINFKNKKYDQLVNNLKSTTSAKEKKILCRKAIDLLIENYALIPMGEIHFAYLAKPEFVGWRVNELNHIDLSELAYRPVAGE